ncbi:MAG: hypothetical protein LBQ50_03160 [Planctomycetaceae bacterium]|jgi:hypothetical protein|nr:hypothetical protein [Planctomycetaceae bacterium]
MKIRDLFEHYGVLGNPFAEEDAQNDVVFKSSCIKTSFHSAWDKIYGNPADPATSVVFGEKGSGKTALRIQMIRMLTEYNTDHSEKRPIVLDYSDLNPFIDRFRHRFPQGRKIQKVLARWELWDHLDAILSLGVTQLIDRILEPGQTVHPAAVDLKPLPIEKLNLHQVRDLLLLASCYDTSRSENSVSRWNRLAKKLRYRTWKSFFSNYWDFLPGVLGIFGTLVSFWAAFQWAGSLGFLMNRWFYLVLLVLWLPLLWKMLQRFGKAWSMKRSLRVLPHLKSNLFKILMRFRKPDFNGMPFPVSGNTDHRYEMLAKLLGVCDTLGLNGLIVLMDRVDEPYLVNGSAELMKLIVWPIFDNKLLKHERVGLKLLLPNQLLDFMERENKDFHQRARLDKQNLIRSLDWTGESLFDLTNARLIACAADGWSPSITDFFEPSLDRRRLVDAFAKLKVPRHLFKFLYGLLGQHVNKHTDTEPVWKIPEAMFESVLSLYLRDRDAAERHLGVV